MGNPLVSVLGTVAVVGPVELAPNDTTYHHIAIQERDGTMRDFATVAAVPGVSQLVEPDVTGLFVFWETADDCRLWCVVCEDGRQAVDFEALRAMAS